MWLATGLLVLALLNLKAPVEGYEFYPRYQPRQTPPHFVYLHSQPSYRHEKEENAFISSKGDLNNVIPNEESNIKFKPSSLLLTEEPEEEESERRSFYRGDVEKSLKEVYENEAPQENPSVRRLGRRQGSRSRENNRYFEDRGRDPWRPSSREYW